MEKIASHVQVYLVHRDDVLAFENASITKHTGSDDPRLHRLVLRDSTGEFLADFKYDQVQAIITLLTKE